MLSLRTGRQRRASVTIALVLCLLATLSACGQKGPLYLPEPEPETQPEQNQNRV
ncbi:LPS translocon maturation chaperone LptM [Gilvimarinus sp. F26214L]|uniref:LPS translocon maturation chaperone LptM n=1 Tax=Gilvimarinus sp. DZF01 TaxID=3461371 RepID=UPI004045676C